MPAKKGKLPICTTMHHQEKAESAGERQEITKDKEKKKGVYMDMNRYPI